MLKKEHWVLWPFVRFPWVKLTFKEVKKLSDKKSESYIYDTLKKLVKEGLLNEERVGNVVLYSLNLASPKTQSYAGFVAEYVAWNQKHIPYKVLDSLASKVPSSFFTLIITGSYAKNFQRKDSDLDLVLLVDDNTEPKKVYAELKHECELSIPPVHLYVFKSSEFLTMLVDKKANYGKELAKNNLILCGAQNYLRIMMEAMRNGFNG